MALNLGVNLDRSRPGVWLSGAAHAALLLGALVAASAEKLPDAEEGIPVEMVTENQLSEMTKGETAAKVVQPKPRAERVAEAREIRDPGEAKRDAPAPPKRPAEVKAADEDTQAEAPPPPLRVAEAKPEPAAAPPPPPAPPSRPDQARADAAKAEAAKADAAKAEAAKAAAERLEEQRDAEALENARREAVKAAQAKADAKARAEAAASKARADAEAKAEAKAELDAKLKALADAQAKADKTNADKAKAEAERQKEAADAKAQAAADAKADAKAEADAKAKAKAVAMAKAKADAETKARRQAEAAEAFNPGDIRQLLASKEAAQSTGSTGREVQKTASLGTATGSSQRMNPSQRDQLVGLLSEQLHKCWQVPIAAQSADKPPIPSVRVKLNQDGTLAAEPVVMNSGNQLFQTVADSATRATRRCAPLKIPAQFAPFYQDWRDLVVNFDPRDMG